MDMGYRGLMPLRLGSFLCRAASTDIAPTGTADLDSEHFATARQVQLAEDEERGLSQKALHIRPAISVTTLLALGLRKLRAEYAERLDAFSQLLRAQDAASPAPPVALADHS